MLYDTYLNKKWERYPLPGGHKTPSLRENSSKTLDLCRSRIPLAKKDSSYKTLNGPALLMKMELGLKPDSGPFQHILLQEILKEGGRIPKQEILFP